MQQYYAIDSGISTYNSIRQRQFFVLFFLIFERLLGFYSATVYRVWTVESFCLKRKILNLVQH